MVAGYSFKREDGHMKNVLELTSYIFTSKIFPLAMTLPWIRFLFPSLTGYNKRLKALHLMREQIRDEIRKYEEDLMKRIHVTLLMPISLILRIIHIQNSAKNSW